MNTSDTGPKTAARKGGTHNVSAGVKDGLSSHEAIQDETRELAKTKNNRVTRKKGATSGFDC